MFIKQPEQWEAAQSRMKDHTVGKPWEMPVHTCVEGPGASTRCLLYTGFAGIAKVLFNVPEANGAEARVCSLAWAQYSTLTI